MSKPATLHGREDELDRIEGLVCASREESGRVLVLRGEAGIGKSALLDAARSAALGAQVLGCRGTECESRLAFAGLHQLLRPILAADEAIPPVQARALRCALGLEADTSRPERFLVSLAALSLLGEAAERSPLLCVIDDAHLLDDATVDVLVFVARRLGAEPIAMLFAAREGEDARLTTFGLPGLRLEGLGAAASRAVLAERAGALAPEVADWLVDATEGNPLALVEMSGRLSDGQRAGIEPILGPMPIGLQLERAFLERVRRLPPATQSLLLVAATDDSGDVTTLLDAAARLGVPADALDEAERASLIRVRGMQFELRHPLVRSAIYQGAPLSRRRAAHAALASVLVGESRADRRAWHRAAASVAPDPEVVDELERAAVRARERGGYDAASLALERAAALAPDERRQAALLTAAAENAWLPGQGTRARALLRRARGVDADPAVRADGGRILGLIEMTSGVPADSTRILADAAGKVADRDPDRALYLLSLASCGAAFVRNGDAIDVLAGCAEPLPVASTPTTSFLRARLAGLRAHFAGDFDAAAAQLRAAVALAAELDPQAVPDRLGFLCPVGLYLCDERAVLDLHRRIAAQSREDGRIAYVTQALPWLTLGDIWGGHWPSAATAIEEGLELAGETGQLQIAAHLLALDGLLSAHRGDEERCRARAAESLQHAAARRLTHVACCATWALTLLELGLGRPEAALAHVRALPRTGGVDWDALDAIEAAVRAGERELAAEWLEAFEPWARSSRAPWGQAVVLHARALLAGDQADAERLFQASLEMHDSAGRPFERARTELAFGELLRRARRRAEARVHLRAALEVLQSLGAELWAERARAELRASGESARKRDPSTLDQLTAQEVHIAQLVAEGLTNRDVAGQLFLSPRTIDFHLRNVFRKLGISSRTELARIDLAGAGGV